MLHELIHALSQNEKRYFKLQSSLMFERNDKRFVKLFDIISNQKEYNEELVKQKCQEKHFPQLKAQLFEKIMDSLRAFHSEKTIQSIIANEMANCRLLLEKMMLKPAYKSLKRAATLAERYELFAELIHIKQTEIDLLVAEGGTEKLQNHINLLREQIPFWNKKTDNQLQVEIIYLLFVKLNREQDFIRTEKEQQALSQYINVAIFKKENNILTTRGKAYYYYILGLYHFLSGNFQESLKAFETQLELLETHKHFAEELINDYAKALANVCLMYNKIKNLNKFNIHFQKLLSLKTNNQVLQKQIQFRNYLLLLNYYVAQSQIDNALKLIKKEEKLINALIEDPSINKSLVTEQNYILFDKVYVFLYLKQFDKANKIIHHYLNTSESSIKSDHYILARILHLFIQLKLANQDYVVNELRNLSRQLKEKEKLFQFEKICLQTIMELCNEQKEKNQKTIWKNFANKISSLSGIKYERNAMFNFNFLEWAQNKLNE